jgi:CDP-diacylglycerol--glycerol-3-phosphate 3-phosphatidyltransferase
MVASDQGRVIAAGWSGKVKTAATMVCVIVMLLLGPETAWAASNPLTAMPTGWLEWIDPICVWVIVLTTLYSGVEYFVKNKDVIASA